VPVVMVLESPLPDETANRVSIAQKSRKRCDGLRVLLYGRTAAIGAAAAAPNLRMLVACPSTDYACNQSSRSEQMLA
jgi:hypothetical protein